MAGDGNNGDLEGNSGGESRTNQAPNRANFRRVEGPVEVVGTAPPVRLLREYKGLTVADLLRDEIVDRLPGQVRTAVNHLRQGDYQAAEQALPGEFTSGQTPAVLPGPGSRRTSTRLLSWVLITAVLLAATLASCWL